MTLETDGALPEKAPRQSTVSTLLPQLSTFSGPFRKKLRNAATFTKSRRGEAIQAIGVAATLVGVFILFGLGVGLVIGGISAVAIGTLHESGRL